MNINRNNYEEFFLLYADKELSAADSRAVEAFAAAHPDLQTEFELLLQTVLPQESAEVFMDKDVLFKTTDTDSLVNMTNYESYFVKYSDEELSNEEKASTELFIYTHPECQAELELIQQIKYQPDQAIRFPDKSLLYRKEEESRRPVIALWMRYAAAAIFILVAGIYWLQQAEQNVSIEQPVAVTNPIPTPSMNQEKTTSDPVVLEKDLIANSGAANPAAQPKKSSLEIKKAIEAIKPVQQKAILQVAENHSKAVQQVLADLATKPPVEETKIAAPIKDEQPVISTVSAVPDPTAQPSQASYASNAAKEDFIYVDNTPETRKTPLRGLLRKATRFVEQKNPLSSDHKKGGVFTASNEQ